MKVAIFETEHFEGAYPVIRLFDNGSNDITIFTIPSSYKQFEYLFSKDQERYSWVVQKSGQSKYNFIVQMFREIKERKIELLYLNTISNNFIAYAIMSVFLPKVRVIVTMHAINSYFRYQPSLSIRRFVRFIGRKSLIARVKEFNVVSQTMTGYLQVKLGQTKKVHCIPGAVFEESLLQQLQPAISSRVNLVVPGSIDGRRRDYEQVFLLLQALEERKIPVTITLLGAFYGEYGQQMIQKCKVFQPVYTRLDFYEFNTVDQHEFDRVMNEANLVWIPSVINTVIEDGVAETYGQSISSGNLFDIIKHAKPFIIPSTLLIDEPLEKSCFRYIEPIVLAGWISSLHAGTTDYEMLLLNALSASREYTIQKVRERNADIFFTA